MDDDLKPHYDDGQARFYHGDVIDVLRRMPAKSVQTCVTSPPYWGLRDYGTGEWSDGDPECDHVGPPRRTTEHVNANTHGRNDVKVPAIAYREECGKCGARRVDQQLGLEPTPADFVAKMVEVFDAVRRVLRDDGTLWLNIGDTYNAGTNASRVVSASADHGYWATEHDDVRRSAAGLKPKDLVGIPWRLAFALQAAGWWLRADIVWHKPNPMPESTTDRPTKAHEYVFLLAKSERYFYDGFAVQEPASANTHARFATGEPRKGTPKGDRAPDRVRGNSDMRAATAGYVPFRNKRDVWTIPTDPYPEAHFATFPPALVRPCILAGSSEKGACSACGSPWRRIIATDDESGRLGKSYHDHVDDLGRGQRGVPPAEGAPVRRTVGWQPTCSCFADEPYRPSMVRPCVVLDPFIGAGTTALVAKELGRHAVGIDLSAEYLAMAERRCAQLSLLGAM